MKITAMKPTHTTARSSLKHHKWQTQVADESSDGAVPMPKRLCVEEDAIRVGRLTPPPSNKAQHVAWLAPFLAHVSGRHSSTQQWQATLDAIPEADGHFDRISLALTQLWELYHTYHDIPESEALS